MNIDVEKLANQNIGKITRDDRIAFRVRDLHLECDEYLNPVEKGFLEDMYELVLAKKTHRISPKQEKWILRLWSTMHEHGRVQLPKGMF